MHQFRQEIKNKWLHNMCLIYYDSVGCSHLLCYCHRSNVFRFSHSSLWKASSQSVISSFVVTLVALATSNQNNTVSDECHIFKDLWTDIYLFMEVGRNRYVWYVMNQLVLWKNLTWNGIMTPSIRQNLIMCKAKFREKKYLIWRESLKSGVYIQKVNCCDWGLC